jgi:hypothetical protein
VFYELIGIIISYRQEVRPFNAKQIELVKSFAAQAIPMQTLASGLGMLERWHGLSP